MSTEARDFLEAIAGYSNASVGGPKPSAERPVKIGTIDVNYTSGQARVLFDGESVISKRGYSWVSTYTPVNGERVFLIPVGQTYIIGGSVASSIPYARYINMPLFGSWTTFDANLYHPASFTKTDSGLVKVTGLVKNGTTTNDTVIGTMPNEFRPPKTGFFPAMHNGGVGALTVLASGAIAISEHVTNPYLSLSNIVIPPAGLTWNSVTLLNGFHAAWDKNMGAPMYAKDSLGRIWLRGGVGRDAGAPAADTPMFILPTGFRPQFQNHFPAVTLDGTASSFGLVDVTAAGEVRWKTGTTTPQSLGFDGVMFPAAGASWTTATLMNGWGNLNSSQFGSAQYRKDSDGTVHLRGLVNAGTMVTPILTLPSGMRPIRTIIRTQPSNNAIGRMDIEASGSVFAVSGSNSWFSLDGTSFTAEH